MHTHTQTNTHTHTHTHTQVHYVVLCSLLSVLWPLMSPIMALLATWSWILLSLACSIYHIHLSRHFVVPWLFMYTSSCAHACKYAHACTHKHTHITKGGGRYAVKSCGQENVNLLTRNKLREPLKTSLITESGGAKVCRRERGKGGRGDFTVRRGWTTPIYVIY